MKKYIYLLCLMVFSMAGMAQTNKKTDSIKVYGNCDMCKATIEGALKKKDGIISKKWDKDTKILSITYDAAKINTKQVAEKIAAAGYDNEYAKAPESAYKNLHSCCQYERPEKSK